MDVVSKLDELIASADTVLDPSQNNNNNQIYLPYASYAVTTTQYMSEAITIQDAPGDVGLHRRHRGCDSEACAKATKNQEGLTHFLREENYDRLYRTKDGVPRCVLVCDGGGLKGYMSIHILKGLETQLKAIAKEDGQFPNIELYQVFDLILGTSTGGLISIGLGKLQLTCDEIIKFYDEVGSEVFATHDPNNGIYNKAEDWFNSIYRNAKTVAGLVADVGKLNTNTFEHVLQKNIKQYVFTKDPNEFMYNPNNPNTLNETKCGVIATLCNNNDFQNAMIIRSYNVNREMALSKKLAMKVFGIDKIDNQDFRRYKYDGSGNDDDDDDNKAAGDSSDDSSDKEDGACQDGNISESSNSDVERQASVLMDASVTYVDNKIYDPSVRMKERTKYDNKGFSECTKHFKLVLPGIHECKIWEAARATSAAPTYFEDMIIDMPKSMAISVIKRNICFTCNVGQNPLTKHYDFAALYFDKLSKNSKPKKILHKIAKQIYNLKYNKGKKDNKKDNNNNKDKDSKPVTKEDIISNINNEFLTAVTKATPDADNKNTTNIHTNENKPNNKKEFKKLTLSSFNEFIYDVDYTLRFQDGGLAANSPLSFGYNESLRLWPDSDVVMLSIGCGIPFLKNYFNHDKTSAHAGRIFSSMFGAKDITGLFEMLSISACPGSDFKMQRMNPEVNEKGKNGGNLLDMADFTNMKEWAEIGNGYAKNHETQLKDWAKFLYKQFKEKPEKHLTNVKNNNAN